MKTSGCRSHSNLTSVGMSVMYLVGEFPRLIFKVCRSDTWDVQIRGTAAGKRSGRRRRVRMTDPLPGPTLALAALVLALTPGRASLLTALGGGWSAAASEPEADGARKRRCVGTLAWEPSFANPHGPSRGRTRRLRGAPGHAPRHTLGDNYPRNAAADSAGISASAPVSVPVSGVVSWGRLSIGLVALGHSIEVRRRMSCGRALRDGLCGIREWRSPRERAGGGSRWNACMKAIGSARQSGSYMWGRTVLFSALPVAASPPGRGARGRAGGDAWGLLHQSHQSRSERLFRG